VPGAAAKVCQATALLPSRCSFSPTSSWFAEECKGTRFKQQILDVRYRGKNIHDVLNMTIREALTFFRDITKIVNKAARDG